MVRAEAETLERYVRRLHEAGGDEPWQSAADVIERYARLLYGGIGTSEGVEMSASRWLHQRGASGDPSTVAG
jgi:hypothetical protein